MRPGDIPDVASCTVGPSPVGDGMLRRGREQLPGGAHQPQPVVVAPHQGLLPQGGKGAGERRRDGRVAAVTGQQREEFLVRRRVRGHGQRLRRLQRETVQPLQRPHHRRPRPGPGGELGQVRGHGGDEVGAGTQKRGQGDVVPGPERFREGARRNGRVAHPTNGSGLAPAAGPSRCGRRGCAPPGAVR
ncbi:UNVERIFIED_CONTAM: hypothetical protein RKD50_004371 [Streptomyces canus]